MALSRQQRAELDAYTEYPICPDCEHDIYVQGVKGRSDDYKCVKCGWRTDV
jgi:tRNA(Ile2) C34 agmatinyltransferase TiaS